MAIFVIACDLLVMASATKIEIMNGTNWRMRI
jgi:hypothetical protein